MDTTKGYYSVIQYCPDESRLEAINIGVVLFCPDVRFLKARFSENSRSKILKALGQQDWQFIENQKRSILHRLSDPDAFESGESFARFAATRANAIHLSEPRPLKTQSPTKTVEDLFTRLVGESKRIVRAPGMSRELTKIFRTQGVLSLVKRNLQVSIPKLGKTVKASYGYQNGRFNLLQPEQFGLSDHDQVFQKASRLAIEGRFLFDDRDPELGDLRLVIVGQFKAAQQEVRGQVTEIFKKNDVELYTFDEIEPLLKDIRINAEKHRPTDLLMPVEH